MTNDTERLAQIEANLARYQLSNIGHVEQWITILDMAGDVPWLCAELRSAWQRIEALEAQVAQLQRQAMEFEGEL